MDDASFQAYTSIRGSLALAQSRPDADCLQRRQRAIRLPRQARRSGEPVLSRRNWRWWPTSGSLVQPLTRAQYQAQQAPLPSNLFSHSDQQLQWQTSVAQGHSPTGWAGRVADYIAAQNINSSHVSGVLLGGRQSPARHRRRHAAGCDLARRQSLALTGFNYSAASQARLNALTSLLTSRQRRLPGAGRQQHAGEQHRRRHESLAGAGQRRRRSRRTFPSHLARRSSCSRWRRSSRCRPISACSRQIFFCSLGGFDTHAGELQTHDTLYPQLSQALAAFYTRHAGTGTWRDSVTTFTESDFSRTFQPTTGDGSDHAWGSHHLVMGGAVQGGQIYGAFPTFRARRPERHRHARTLDSDHVHRSIRRDAVLVVRHSRLGAPRGVSQLRELRLEDAELFGVVLSTDRGERSPGRCGLRAAPVRNRLRARQSPALPTQPRRSAGRSR